MLGFLGAKSRTHLSLLYNYVIHAFIFQCAESVCTVHASPQSMPTNFKIHQPKPLWVWKEWQQWWKHVFVSTVTINTICKLDFTFEGTGVFSHFEGRSLPVCLDIFLTQSIPNTQCDIIALKWAQSYSFFFISVLWLENSQSFSRWPFWNTLAIRFAEKIKQLWTFTLVRPSTWLPAVPLAGEERLLTSPLLAFPHHSLCSDSCKVGTTHVNICLITTRELCRALSSLFLSPWGRHDLHYNDTVDIFPMTLIVTSSLPVSICGLIRQLVQAIWSCDETVQEAGREGRQGRSGGRALFPPTSRTLRMKELDLIESCPSFGISVFMAVNFWVSVKGVSKSFDNIQRLSDHLNQNYIINISTWNELILVEWGMSKWTLSCQDSKDTWSFSVPCAFL